MEKTEIFTKVQELVNQLLINDPVELILGEQSLKDDLGVDSLDSIDLMLCCELEFDINIPDEMWDSVVTVNDVVDLVYNLTK